VKGGGSAKTGVAKLQMEVQIFNQKEKEYLRIVKRIFRPKTRLTFALQGGVWGAREWKCVAIAALSLISIKSKAISIYKQDLWKYKTQ